MKEGVELGGRGRESMNEGVELAGGGGENVRRRTH